MIASFDFWFLLRFLKWILSTFLFVRFCDKVWRKRSFSFSRWSNFRFFHLSAQNQFEAKLCHFWKTAFKGKNQKFLNLLIFQICSHKLFETIFHVDFVVFQFFPNKLGFLNQFSMKFEKFLIFADFKFHSFALWFCLFCPKIAILKLYLFSLFPIRRVFCLFAEFSS